MSLRAKLLTIVGIVFFLVLAGTATANALWSTPASISSSVKAANLADSCTNVTSMINASFEEPAYGDASINYPAFGAMPGWRSYNAAGSAVRSEVWSNGALGVSTPVGRQFLELNADVPGTLRQTLSTTPGQTLQWSFLHRGRAGVDTVELRIGAVGAGISQGQFSDGTSGWVRYSGAYVVPAGQTTTELSFIAISTATGDPSVGNFLDDVSFGTGPCLTATSTVSNITNPGGSYRVGDVIEYTTTAANIGSSTAMSSALSVALPATVELQAGSITVDGLAKTDSASDDTAEYTAGSRALTARLGSLATTTAGGTIAQGANSVLKFRAVIQAAGAGTTVSYVPSVAYVNGLAPTWPLSVAAADTAISVAAAADLGVTVTATPATVNRAATTTSATWTVVLTNNGPGAATGASVALALPAGTGTATPTGSGVTCTTGTTTSTCTVAGSLAVGASRTITITRTVPASPTVGALYTVTATASATTFDQNADNNSASASVTIVDTQAPTTPGTPTTGTITANTAVVTWTASTDNASVAGYEILRDGVVVGTSTTNSYTATGLTPGAAYSFTVRAYDPTGNRSAASGVRTVTTVYDTTSYYSFTSSGGLCIGTSGTANGADLTLQNCAPTTTTQWWRFTSVGSGYYNILGTGGNGWDLENRTTANTDKVELYNQLTNTYQQWLPVVYNDAGVVSYSFMNRATGKCVVPANAAQLGSVINQATCDPANPAQRFTLAKVN